MRTSHFFQIDPDFRRRARFAEFAQALGFHSEPFESISEMVSFLTGEGVLFVCDKGSLLRDTFHALEAYGRWLPVAAYGMEPSVERAVDAMRMGALDYYAWPLEPDQLRPRVFDILERAEDLRGEANLRATARTMVATLSPREAEVLCALAEGGSNKSIAQELAISPRTVEIHRANMLGKLGTRTSAAAIALAVRADLPSALRARAERGRGVPTNRGVPEPARHTRR